MPERVCCVSRVCVQTAEEAIEHGAEQCGVVSNGRGGRVYDDKGCTACLWDGCARGWANPISASNNKHGVFMIGGSIHAVRNHEKEHSKGAAPKG